MHYFKFIRNFTLLITIMAKFLAHGIIHSMSKIKIIEVVVVLGVIIGIIYWFVALRGKSMQGIQSTQQAEEASSALLQVTSNTPQVAPSVNPAASAIPAVNPIEKTNPFKNEYKNPFE